MKRKIVWLCSVVVLFFSFLFGQQHQTAVAPSIAVPHLIRFTGVLKDGGRKPLSGVDVTFDMYKEEQGGAPLWLETQSVQCSRNSTAKRYTGILCSPTRRLSRRST